MVYLAPLLAFLYLVWPVLAQFNATFRYAFPAIAPHFDLYKNGPFEWIYDDDTGYSVSQPRQDRRAVPFPLSVVGENFTLYGEPTKVMNVTDGLSVTLLSPVTGDVERFQNSTGPVNVTAEVAGNWTRMEPRVLNMWAVKQPSTRLTLHNITVDIPVRTQATTPDMWEKQSRYSPVAKYGAITLDMKVQSFNSSNIIPDAGQPFWLGSSGEVAEVSGNDLVLESLMELVFAPPANTSLVRVLGPVGPNIQQLKTTPFDPELPVCVALLDPAPPWLQSTLSMELEHFVMELAYNWPMAWQAFPRNFTNTTLFLLPLDPTVQYKVKILPRRNTTLCVVSGFQTYPFHFDYTVLNIENTTESTQNTTTDISKTLDKGGNGSQNKGSNRTAVIAGSVAGAVAALLAIGAAVFLTRRCLTHHRTKAEPGFEVDYNASADEVTPFIGGFLSRVRHSTRVSHKNIGQPAVTQTEVTQSGSSSHRVQPTGNRNRSRTKHHSDDINATVSPDVAPASSSSDVPQARVVHDEDAEDAALEVLPPMYSEEWTRRRTNMVLQDGASRVTRVEDGQRAADGSHSRR